MTSEGGSRHPIDKPCRRGEWRRIKAGLTSYRCYDIGGMHPTFACGPASTVGQTKVDASTRVGYLLREPDEGPLMFVSKTGRTYIAICL